MQPNFEWVARCVGDSGCYKSYVFVDNGTAYASDGVTGRRAPVDMPNGWYAPSGEPMRSMADSHPISGLFLSAQTAPFERCNFDWLASNKPTADGYFCDPAFLAAQGRTDALALIKGAKPCFCGMLPAGRAFIIAARTGPVDQRAAEIGKQLWADISGDVFLSTRDHSAEGAEPVSTPHLLRINTKIRDVCLRESTVLPSIDFETYSEVAYTLDEDAGKVKGRGSQSKGGLPVSGTPAYAEHPSTEILCLYYNMKDGRGPQAYIPGLTAEPVDLLDYIANGGHVEAFNITFEWWIWNMIGARRHGWPPLDLEQCHCVMARSRRFGIPGSLAGAAEALGVEGKDDRGKKLLTKLTRPHTKTKHRREWRHLPWTAWDDFQALYEYCGQDTIAEDNVAARVPDLTPYEREIWLADQRVNARGVQVDRPFLDAALDVMYGAQSRYTVELCQITDGKVPTGSSVEKMREFLQSLGVRMPNLGADTVDEALGRDDLPPLARRVLEIRQALSGANIKKLPTLDLQLNSDARLRDQYVYCGASRTGRWSTGGVQLQNLTAKGPKTKQCDNCGQIMGAVADECPHCMDRNATKLDDWTVDAVEATRPYVIARDVDALTNVWGDQATLLAGCLRGMFIAKPGHDLICCDFSAIEAVVLACLARCQWRIDVFNSHGKIYEMSAAKISGVSFEEMLQYKKDNGHDHPLRKSLGKVAELASGYGGWIGAWKAFGAEKHFDGDDQIKQAIIGWREASPEIVEFWGGQHRQIGAKPWDSRPELFGLEGAAVAAIQNPGKCYTVGDLQWGVYQDILMCRLPSGRYLHYHKPRLVDTTDPLRRPIQQITFMGHNSNPQNGRVGWTRMKTYGGRLAENVTQAVSADIQGEALVRLERANYPVVMHTHDEAISEVPEGVGSVAEMEAIMAERPGWAQWWPIRAAGWRHKRYQKD